MLKKIFRTVDNLFKRSDTKSESKQNYVLEQKFISNNAIDTIKKLQKAGYEAYLVGGCIRDLLLNIQPKDFDVATNATPEQVKKVIRNSRIIGRRFKLVHVFWGRETIEVATFRGPHEQARADNESVQHSSGRILRDNVYGSMDQDAYRRDFTINAFYYDVTKKKLLDPIGGLKDIKNKTLAVIGDPTQRYQEDPVRMLRVVRFAAKLDFCVEPLSEAPIYHLSYLLADVPAARLFDEVLKLFLSGKALRVFELLCQYNLFKILFPKIGEVLSTSPQAEKFIRQALSNTDDRLNSGKTVNPAFLYATFLWPVLQQRLGQSSWLEKLPNLLELQEVANELIFEQSKYTTIPKRFGIPMREIWEAQIRLAKRQGKKADLLLSHPRFRAGYDFLLLRESVGEDTGGLGAWWTKYQQLDDQHRRVMMQDLSGNNKTTKKRYRYKPKAKKVEI